MYLGLLPNAWLRGVDLNHRPLGYEPNELPGCSTPHLYLTQALRRSQACPLPREALEDSWRVGRTHSRCDFPFAGQPPGSLLFPRAISSNSREPNSLALPGMFLYPLD